MRFPSGIVACLMVVLAPGGAQAQPTTEEHGLGSEVRRIFTVKCAGCHGPDLPKPQGRFGYVLDLRRVAGNPEMVIPGRPDESELWALVSHGDMPPADSPRGPLTAAEKEMVRAWIAAGAPDVAVPQPEREQPTAVSISTPQRAMRFLGKFHLLLLHFPIALLIAAGLGEFLQLRQDRRVPSPVVRFCLTLAALAAIPTVVFGWFHAAAGSGVAVAETLSLHRWLGTGTGVWVLIAALWAWRDSQCGTRSWSGRVALAGSILLVIATAHLGGLLTHGRHFFDW